MEGLKKFYNANKKKVVALILALILSVVGMNLPPQQQETIVNFISSVLPDAEETPAAPPVETTQPRETG